MNAEEHRTFNQKSNPVWQADESANYDSQTLKQKCNNVFFINVTKAKAYKSTKTIIKKKVKYQLHQFSAI